MSFETPLPPYNASDPHATFLNSSCLDLLLIEMVPMAYRLANELSIQMPNGDKLVDEEEHREAAFRRLETLGYRVGQGLVERRGSLKSIKSLMVSLGAVRFSRDRPRFTETLDVIKFLCKDLWTLVFRKQIDNLKTNHRGIFVLTDNTFRPFARMSTSSSSEAAMQAQPFLWFPCGIIRGALACMGINAAVQAETSELPSATFQIKTIAAKT
ncbi:Trafficking protein particle complex subunit 33 [Toensbergia leucococca]|nr:Trafficking protein particle complex subunit 33 [Toensbergia leucococca]